MGSFCLGGSKIEVEAEVKGEVKTHSLGTPEQVLK